MKNYLQINDLNFSYPDGYEALKNINLEINKGDTLGVLGPNGAGKTTFILHLNGILGNLDDSIYINNLSINEDNLKKLEKK